MVTLIVFPSSLLSFLPVTEFYLYVKRPKRDKATEEWRRPHNEEQYDLYPSTNINRVIKSS
jgi:hypothetical protein